MDLTIQHYHSATGATIYAALFDNSGNALHLEPSTNYEFVAYPGIMSHSDFCYAMTEHTDRSFLYELTILDADLDIVATPINKVYHYEIWDNNNDRADVLLATGSWLWSGSNIMDTRLDTIDKDAVSHHECHFSIGFNSQTNIATVTVWLEKNGELITNPTEGQATIYDRQGNAIFDVTHSSYLSGVNGVYSFSSSISNLIADQSMFVRVRVRHNGTDYVTGESVNSWD